MLDADMEDQMVSRALSFERRRLAVRLGVPQWHSQAITSGFFRGGAGRSRMLLSPRMELEAEHE